MKIQILGLVAALLAAFVLVGCSNDAPAGSGNVSNQIDAKAKPLGKGPSAGAGGAPIAGGGAKSSAPKAAAQ